MQNNLNTMLNTTVSGIKSKPSDAVRILENFLDEYQFGSLNAKQKSKTVEAMTEAARDLLSVNDPASALKISHYIWGKSDNSNDSEESLSLIPDISVAFAVAGNYLKAAETLRNSFYDVYDGGKLRTEILSSGVKIGVICFGADGDTDTAEKFFEMQYNLSNNETAEEKVAQSMLDSIRNKEFHEMFPEVCKKLSVEWENEKHYIPNPFRRFCV